MSAPLGTTLQKGVLADESNSALRKPFILVPGGFDMDSPTAMTSILSALDLQPPSMVLQVLKISHSISETATVRNAENKVMLTEQEVVDEVPTTDGWFERVADDDGHEIDSRREILKEQVRQLLRALTQTCVEAKAFIMIDKAVKENKIFDVLPDTSASCPIFATYLQGTFCEDSSNTSLSAVALTEPERVHTVRTHTFPPSKVTHVLVFESAHHRESFEVQMKALFTHGTLLISGRPSSFQKVSTSTCTVLNHPNGQPSLTPLTRPVCSSRQWTLSRMASRCSCSTRRAGRLTWCAPSCGITCTGRGAAPARALGCGSPRRKRRFRWRPAGPIRWRLPAVAGSQTGTRKKQTQQKLPHR